MEYLGGGPFSELHGCQSGLPSGGEWARNQSWRHPRGPTTLRGHAAPGDRSADRASESPAGACCTLGRSQPAPQLTDQRTETHAGEATSPAIQNDNDRNARVRKCGPQRDLGPQMTPHRGRLRKRQKGWRRSRVKWGPRSRGRCPWHS